MVQWLRLRAFNAGGVSSIPGRGTKSPHATWCGQKIKIKKLNKIQVKYSSHRMNRSGTLFFLDICGLKQPLAHVT